MTPKDKCKACDADLMKFLTDDERALATADNVGLWRPLAILRKCSTVVVDRAERVDLHGTFVGIDTEYILALHDMVRAFASDESMLSKSRTS